MTTAIFPGRYDQLEKIAEFVKQAAQEAGLSASELYAVETAVDEACSNIIEHAYGQENMGTIECTCTCNGNDLKIILIDHGKPFKPEKIKKPNLKSSLKNHQGHGLGMFFMRQYMDEVTFDFRDNANILTMIKHGTESPT